MTGKADAVRAVSQQFKDRTNAVIEGVMAHLRDDNAKEILGPGLSPLIGRGSLKSIVTFALYADVLRMVRDMVMADGEISDEEVQESLGLLSVLAAGFAKVRKEYAAFTQLTRETARKFLLQYESDAGLFGHINDTTKWVGVDVCRQVEACCGDSQPISNLRHALVQWAEAIAASDETSESEEAVLHSIRGLMGVPASGQIDDSRESHTEGNVLTKEVAEEFLGNPDAVDLCGFTEIDEEAASVLCRHSGDLNLDGVTTLTPSVAAVLSRFDGGMLSFGGLTTLSREAAERLSSTVCSLHLYISEFDPDVQEILRGHPSLRIDDSRLESWLLERCGFENDNEGQAWIGEGLLEALCEAADKYTFRDPDSTDAWLMVDCYHPFDEGFAIVKQAGNRQIHLVSLQDDRRHLLVFIGRFEKICERLDKVMTRLINTNAQTGNGVGVSHDEEDTVAECDDDTVLTKEVAIQFCSTPDSVDLSSYTTLTDDAAAVLAEMRGDLYLTGITHLSAKAATLLSQHQEGELWLDGLTSLPYELIEPLVQHAGRLTFDGVREVSLRAAQILAKRTGPLGLNGVKTISPEVAEVFAASHMESLELLGLTEPPDRVLLEFSGDLCLREPSEEGDEPRILTKEVASQFCLDDNSVDLSEYTAITDDAADVLATYAGPFLFLDVTEINDYVAKRLASRPCSEGSDLRLLQVASLSEESVISLASWPGELRFSTDRLTPTASRALGNHAGPVLSISELQELPLEVAANLAKHRGHLSLMFRYDADLSTEALEAICRRGQQLSVTANHFDGMSDSLAAAIGKCQGDIDIGCSSLTASQAEQIAGISGRLELNSLDTDSEAVITALSKHRGSLSLQGLQSLSVNAARSLSKHEGEVSLCLRHSELEAEVLRIFDRYPEVFGDTSDPLA